MSKLRIASALFIAILVSACGFRPLYGPSPSADARVSERLSGVAIATIPDRTGQLVRNALLQRINPFGQPSGADFRLSVQIDETIQNLAVQIDETATRANLILRAQFDLIQGETGENVFSGTVQSVNSYNISSLQHFATLSAEQDARRRGARDLADEITARLALFLAET